MRGNALCTLILYAWIAIILHLFSKYPPRRIVLFIYFGAFMFLPMDKLNLPLILYNKMTATSIGVMIAIKMFDEERLAGYKIHPIDIPMWLWCCSGFFASVANGLGPKDGIQECWNTFMIWGAPYLVGRLYFADPDSLKFLCRVFFIAGLMYIPLVLYELKMSPQLHRIVWGYMQHDFSQTIRGGGYRPMVFMEHGIMLGMWVCMAAMIGVWCAWAKVLPKKMWQKPTVLFVLALVATAIAAKSSGAIGLMIIGLAALFISTNLRIALIFWVLLAMPPLYVVTRATGYWDGQNLVDLVAEKFSEDRSESLAFRFDNENILIEKALEKPLFGWGGWGRSRVYNDEGEDISVTDGFWIITMGTRGYFGLFSVTLAMIIPTLLLVIRAPPRLWAKPEYAPTAVLALIPLLFMIDSLLNAMVNPLYMILAGGISGMLAIHGDKLIKKKAVETKEKLAVPDAVPEIVPDTGVAFIECQSDKRSNEKPAQKRTGVTITSRYVNESAYALTLARPSNMSIRFVTQAAGKKVRCLTANSPRKRKSESKSRKRFRVLS
ncbi:O-antigen ligase family protein [Desulfococcaceae bacterium HSG7]|nr:O-antigen ligase family protein [Desulfococcaceae bacterium HSG7]